MRPTKGGPCYAPGTNVELKTTISNSGHEMKEQRDDLAQCAPGLTRGAWDFRGRPPGKDWRFPFKLSRDGAENSKRIVTQGVPGVPGDPLAPPSGLTETR
jgi:hypothetical protein